jgi:hypothetical protein
MIKKNNNIYQKFYKSNWYYLPPNTNCSSLVIYGSNITSTIGYPKFTSILRNTVNISPFVKNIIIGILISDGWLQRNKSGHTRLGFKQSLINIEYFYFIFTKLSHYCSTTPKLAQTILNNKNFYGIYLSTRSYPCLTKLYELFYQDKIKIVPHNLYDLLNYEVLAHWIMCDGTKTGNSIVLQTQSFTIKEAVFIINIFILKLDINATIHMQRNKPVIYIKYASLKKILPKILPYFVDSMKYKIL